jgi:hypothetical protein
LLEIEAALCRRSHPYGLPELTSPAGKPREAKETTPDSTALRERTDQHEAVLKVCLGQRVVPLLVCNPAELAQGLDRTWQFMAECLARWSPADMHQTFPDDWDGTHVDLSRAWVVWHVLEHDLHQSGELSLTLGMHELPANFPG